MPTGTLNVEPGIRGAEGAWEEGNIRVVLERVVDLRGDGGDPVVGVVTGLGCHGDDVAVGGIDDDDGAAFCAFIEGGLGDALDVRIEGGDDIGAGLRRDGDFFGGLLAGSIEGEVELAVLAGELGVEGEFEAVAAFGDGPEFFVGDDGAIGGATATAHVADDLAGHGAVRVKALVNRLEGEMIERLLFDGVDLGGVEVEGDVERKQAAVVVVLEDRFVGDGDGAAEEVLGKVELLMGEVEGLGITHGRGDGEIEDEIVTDAGLCEGAALGIGDLAARGGNLEDVGAGLALGVPTGGEGVAGVVRGGVGSEGYGGR